MTTIVWRDGVLAADSLVTQSTTKLPGRVEKIVDLGDSYFTHTGHYAFGMQMLQAIIAEAEDPEWKLGDTICVRVFDDGSVWLYEGAGPWVQEKGPYVAHGSGADYALGALHMGATAIEAVEAAIAFDTGSDGPVRSVVVGARKKPRKRKGKK